MCALLPYIAQNQMQSSDNQEVLRRPSICYDMLGSMLWHSPFWNTWLRDLSKYSTCWKGTFSPSEVTSQKVFVGVWIALLYGDCPQSLPTYPVQGKC